nr:PfkB family carbohydrate kinase [Humibacillus sp. DSM 29435]
MGPSSWNTIVQLAHLPAQRPQTLFASGSWTTLGGTSAGKTLHLAELGVRPLLLSTVVGDDDVADLIRTALTNRGLDVVLERASGRSEQHLNLMAGAARVSIYLSLPAVPPGAVPVETQEAIGRADHVVLDLSERARDAIPYAVSSQATVWTDLHDYDGQSAYHRPFRDAADIVFMSSDALPDPRSLMLEMRAEGKQLVVCTRASEGAIALDAAGWHQVDALPATVVDTNGAGDAFLAGFLSATRGGEGVGSALRSAAAQAVRALGSRHLSPLLDER